MWGLLVLLAGCRYEAATVPQTTPDNGTPDTSVLSILPCDETCNCQVARDIPNDSGITSALSSSGELTDCSNNPQLQDCASGRDANTRLIKQGYGEVGFDFQKVSLSGELLGADANNWQCVLDHVTGLMWETKWQTNAELIGHGTETFTWYDEQLPNYQATTAGECNLSGQCTSEQYVDYINASRLCGFSDWRLPSKLELQQLVQYQNRRPALDPNLFQGLVNARYWSSTIDTDDQGSVWSLNANMGTIAGDSVNNPKAIILVREHSAQNQTNFSVLENELSQSLRSAFAPNQRCSSDAVYSAPLDRFRLTASGDIFDRKTGLIWQRCVLGLSGETCKTGSEEIVAWQDALALASAIRENDNYQWRLPNIKELYSLIETACEEPPLNPVAYPNMIFGRLWTATPNIHVENSVYYVQSQNGISFYDQQTSTAMVQLVANCKE
jgi:hypothetical protein